MSVIGSISPVLIFPNCRHCLILRTLIHVFIVYVVFILLDACLGASVKYFFKKIVLLLSEVIYTLLILSLRGITFYIPTCASRISHWNRIVWHQLMDGRLTMQLLGPFWVSMRSSLTSLESDNFLQWVYFGSMPIMWNVFMPQESSFQGMFLLSGSEYFVCLLPFYIVVWRANASFLPFSYSLFCRVLFVCVWSILFFFVMFLTLSLIYFLKDITFNGKNSKVLLESVLKKKKEFQSL